MTDIHDLVPKNKFDSSNIERLKHLTDNEIEPILPSLLEWIETALTYTYVIVVEGNL